LSDRFDSEYFYKDGLNNQYILERKNSQKFDIFGDFVASAFYPAATHLYEIGETPFIRVTDCINYPIITKEQDDVFEKIPRYFYNKNTSISTLKKGELVISKVGTPCFASLIDDYDEVALSRTVLGVKKIRNINSKYLLLFLRSKYGFEQLLRQRELTIQYQLTLQRVKNILIFVPSEIFQNKLADLVNLSHRKLQDHKTLYKQAEQLILKELDLLDYKSSKEKVAIKNLSESFGVSGRLDSEYYQPKYDEILEKIKLTKYDRLGNIVNMLKSIEPGSEAYQESGIPFVRVSNLTKFEISKPDIHLSKNLFDNEILEKLQPKKDTILLSKDGTVGIAYNVKKDSNFVTSGAILHLSIKRDDVLPEYLTLVLNSLLVQMQSQRDAGGSIIKHWKPSEIKKILIPIINKTIQSQIEQKIKKSFELKEQSKELLDIAKKAVEIAIEEDEDIAMEYINDQI
jgi:restriction endonuclease S subunit